MSERIVLPFIVNAAERAGPISQMEEEAAILALADLGRAKGDDRIAFVAEELYPLWTVQWAGRSLIFDGLAALERTFRYEKSLDPTQLIGRLRESLSNRETFTQVLSDSLRALASFREETVNLGPLVFDSTISNGALTYLEYGQEAGESTPQGLPPRVTLESTLAYADVLTDTISRISDEIEAFRYAATVVDQGVALHLKKLEREIASLKDACDQQIEASRPAVEKRVQEIEKRYEKEIRNAESNRIRASEGFSRERGNLKTEVDRALRELDACERKREGYYRRGDSRGERNWRERAERYRGRIKALASKIAELDRRAAVEDSKLRADIERLREQFKASLAAEESKIKTIETRRDTEIESRREESAGLSSRLSTMAARISSLIERRKTDQQRLELLGVPRKTERSSLLLVPFYSVAYRGPSGERFSFLAPAVARSTNVISQTYGGAAVALAPRMQMLLTPLSRELQYLICTSLVELVKRDVALRGLISEIGLRSNLLGGRDAPERLRLGLEQLSSEGWLSRGEAASLEASILGGR